MTQASCPLKATVLACLTRHVAPGSRIVIGLSGGLDSISLLHVLKALRLEQGFDYCLTALHVNHGLSAAAGQWEAFCHEACDALGIPCHSMCVSVDRGSRDGLEGAARRARHAAFADCDTDWLMLAHHQDDQAETLLFNLLRGTGLAGAAAMRERNGRILRPWLQVSRREIEAYARLHRLRWCEDESNADERHTRNFMRQRIVPELRQRFPAATKNLAAATARFAEAEDLLDILAQQDAGGPAADFPLEVSQLMRLGEARARNVLRHLLAQHHVQIPAEARLKEALRQMLEAAEDRHPAVIFGRHRLKRKKGRIYLEPVGTTGARR